MYRSRKKFNSDYINDKIARKFGIGVTMKVISNIWPVDLFIITFFIQIKHIWLSHSCNNLHTHMYMRNGNFNEFSRIYY